MSSFTPEQKKQHFEKLRNEWLEAKKIVAEQEDRLNAAIKVAGLTGISLNGFVIVERQMKNQGLSGVPVLDAKTFAKWKEEGYRVKKGEKSTLHGITFIAMHSKEDKEKKKEKEVNFTLPKAYNLFHRSQVELIS